MGFTEKLVRWARGRSPWILFFDTGACNACDIEVVAALTPRFDLERFGLLLKGSPRHADILVVTGPVTRQVRDRIIRIYNQMPEPKFVVAAGTCATGGGAFWKCYNTYESLDKVIPVDAYISGCPVKPEAVIQAVNVLVQKIMKG
ncbi:MAG: NADH-quinone oxidoreductase subunit B [Thermofilum sp. ex4484_82]|nr:NADH-quinone oxidoreductase subunit B family protein [Thermoproteales archaeon]OYT28677.1 MAG: NADH-quinone oxidoreductase subunit B [Thermofilum sp. ex4484_82]OYT38721.1 MAG: NADH-quinone oxidoreductase subunit B [Archaeoglobales archaeon ex4484_92]RLE76982.1 MAG: NADH-quinone oxidoreductase subunit B [Thermoprotei archaeon]RLE85774.1 MAG: NADH-quinone oxidoreductase subunit B [Thermoprotei archaeon]